MYSFLKAFLVLMKLLRLSQFYARKLRHKTVVFNLEVSSPVGVVCFFPRVARASDKNIHNFFYIFYFVYGTTFCCS